MYGSGALGVDDVVGWAASLDPSPDVIHIDMRSPTRKPYCPTSGGGDGPQPCGGKCAANSPPLNFCI